MSGGSRRREGSERFTFGNRPVELCVSLGRPWHWRRGLGRVFMVLSLRPGGVQQRCVSCSEPPRGAQGGVGGWGAQVPRIHRPFVSEGFGPRLGEGVSLHVPEAGSRRRPRARFREVSPCVSPRPGLSEAGPVCRGVEAPGLAPGGGGGIGAWAPRAGPSI